MKLIIRRAAQLEVRSVREEYEAKAEGLGARFLAELDGVVARMRSMPKQFPVVWKSLRRALLHRFPYSVYFIIERDAVIIFAVLHQHRDPAVWKRRARQEGVG